MATIRCPKCDAKLMGNNEASLSAAFRDHLSTAHQMKLPSSALGKGGLAYGAADTISGPKVEGAMGAELHGKRHLEERMKAGETGSQENIRVRCPMCGAMVVGVDEDEISGLLKTHLMEHEST